MLAIVGVVLVYAWDQTTMAKQKAAVAEEQAILIQKLEAETERADKLPKLVSKDPEGIRAMEKICLEAIQVTSALATTTDSTAHQLSRERFWELFYGPMYIVELHQAKKSSGTSTIETSMVIFGRHLKAAEDASEPLPQKSLCQDAKAVRDECVKHLKIVAASPCA